MNTNAKLFSIIIPARNEEAQISGTISAALAAVAYYEGIYPGNFHLADTSAEIIVVDNISTDDTPEAVKPFIINNGIHLLSCSRLKAPCARNFGAAQAQGKIFIFIDADTRIPIDALHRIHHLANERGYGAGIFRLGAQESGWKAGLWWAFWNAVRLLPFARAKAMPAFMFCTDEVFDQYGPFDEEVAIGEEWPILARLYKQEPRKFVYDLSITAHSSSRRMEMQPFGYLRSFIKYSWAVLDKRARINLTDSIRQQESDL